MPLKTKRQHQSTQAVVLGHEAMKRRQSDGSSASEFVLSPPIGDQPSASADSRSSNAALLDVADMDQSPTDSVSPERGPSTELPTDPMGDSGAIPESITITIPEVETSTEVATDSVLTSPVAAVEGFNPETPATPLAGGSITL